jgi:hypothetical protein
MAFIMSGNKAPCIRIKLGSRQRRVVAYGYLVFGLRQLLRVQKGAKSFRKWICSCPQVKRWGLIN